MRFGEYAARMQQISYAEYIKARKQGFNPGKAVLLEEAHR